jgi:hypothetical protein
MESFYVIKCKFGKNLPSKRETIKLEKKNNPLELEGKKKWKKKNKTKTTDTHTTLCCRWDRPVTVYLGDRWGLPAPVVSCRQAIPHTRNRCAASENEGTNE